MRLRVDGALVDFIPVKAFRDELALPLAFGVAQFEPKDYTGLGSLERAGSRLNGVREALLQALPTEIKAVEWFVFLPQLTALFTQQLYDINDAIRLRDVEIDFAAAGFGDVCQTFAYEMMRARTSSGITPPPFEAIYAGWLDSTVRVSQTLHPYVHHGESWMVRIVTHAYGRTGLIVTTPRQTYHVYDSALGCPAEGFMTLLLKEVTQRMLAATI